MVPNNPRVPSHPWCQTTPKFFDAAPEILPLIHSGKTSNIWKEIFLSYPRNTKSHSNIIWKEIFLSYPINTNSHPNLGLLFLSLSEFFEEMVERQENAWLRVPDELAERILAYLPISSVFRCRSVCKHWHSLLSSPTFADLWAALAPRTLYFLIYHTRSSVAAYLPRARCWANLPLYDRCSLDPSQVLLLASSAGLLCFRNRNLDYPNLIICNPVTRTSRILPEMLQIRYIDAVGMVADRASGHYRILVMGTTEPASSESITEVYDSETSQWAHHCRSQHEFLQFWHEVHAIFHNGFFYCLAIPVQTLLGYRLITYNLERRDWVDLNVRLPSGDIRCLALVVCRGRLFLTGKIMEDFLIGSICIWELSWESLRWVKVDAVPDEILRKIDSPHSILIHCQGHGDFMCFTMHHGWQSIIYNLLERTWELLPEENHVFDQSQSLSMGRNNLVVLPYEPSLLDRV
ncbi:F-box/kelch-repeat protein At5g15710-like [Magnolia sinica]|uniref:F-box/kelch-repeat protein At5g15710-like n=1 Tax=Magnolia sinica TaxID=86752 RepID=UPI002657C16D|nr:F-box/kelch-repeat protein At5g15710-like [Magnolia sinica]